MTANDDLKGINETEDNVDSKSQFIENESEVNSINLIAEDSVSDVVSFKEENILY